MYYWGLIVPGWIISGVLLVWPTPFLRRLLVQWLCVSIPGVLLSSPAFVLLGFANEVSEWGCDPDVDYKRTRSMFGDQCVVVSNWAWLFRGLPYAIGFALAFPAAYGYFRCP